MQKILVSACLLGQPLRYDGSAFAFHSRLLRKWQGEGRLVPVCPEVAGGLPVPRPPAEIQQGSGAGVLVGNVKVANVEGGDVTASFVAGAEQALLLCRQQNIRVAILTESSPSCGGEQINDGSFTGTKVEGAGVTAALLRQHGVRVFNQFALQRVQQWIGEHGG